MAGLIRSSEGWAACALTSVATKYAQPEELAFSRGSVHRGLGPDEALLVERFFDRESRVLDVGCGAGREAIALPRRGFRVTAIDAQPAMIEHAQREAARAGVTVTFALESVTAFSAPPSSFDHVLFSPLVYAYIPSQACRIDTLARLRSALRGGGTIVFSTYNRKAIPSGTREALRDVARRLARWLLPNAGAREPGDRWVRGVSEVSPRRLTALLLSLRDGRRGDGRGPARWPLARARHLLRRARAGGPALTETASRGPDALLRRSKAIRGLRCVAW